MCKKSYFIPLTLRKFHMNMGAIIKKMSLDQQTLSFGFCRKRSRLFCCRHLAWNAWLILQFRFQRGAILHLKYLPSWSKNNGMSRKKRRDFLMNRWRFNIGYLTGIYNLLILNIIAPICRGSYVATLVCGCSLLLLSWSQYTWRQFSCLRNSILT